MFDTETYFTVDNFGPTDPKHSLRQCSREGSYIPSFIKFGQFKLQFFLLEIDFVM